MTSFPLALSVELLLDGVWTAGTTDVYQRDIIKISRGRADEAGQVEPSRCNLTIDNRTGKYSPRNPVGAHFGKLGRNTQLRVLTPTTLDNYLALPGDSTSHVSTPDAAALDITGDIDVRIEVDPRTWRPGDSFGLARKWDGTGDQRSWALYLSPDGNIEFWWTTGGTGGTINAIPSTVAVPASSSRLALRATLDVNNGAAGNDVRFYTAPAIDGTWTQLGATVTTAGTTSIFASTAPVEVGRVTGPSAPGILTDSLQGKVYAVELRNGINGTLVASPDFTAHGGGNTSFTDAQGRVWAFHGSAVVANPSARFHGEVASWPQKWDTSGSDVWAPIEAAGVMRRLGQGASALKSVLYRALTTLTTNRPVAYWPMEDGGGATEFASGLPGGEAASGAAVADLATFTGFKASSPLPQLNGARVGCNVAGYTHTGEHQTRFLLAVPAGGVAAETAIVRIYTATGSVVAWELRVKADGALILRALDSEGAELFNSGPMGFAVNGKLLRVSVELEAVGADTDWEVLTLEPGQAGLSLSGTLAGRVVGAVRRVGVNSEGGLGDTAFGHLSVQSTITSLFDLADEFNAYTGERAGERILRLCLEEGLALAATGTMADTARTGPQLPKALLDLLREAAATDLGILYEPREFAGLGYRTRADLYAQAAGLALNYAPGHLSAIEPVDDDQATRNDITVTREGGGSARVELTTGALSTAAPPDGVGRYDEEVTISVKRDEDLPDQASWRLHLGTVDEARYPVLGLNLARGAFIADATLTANAQDLDVGDKVTVTNPPAWLPPETISQLAQGFTETLSRFEWTIDVNCSPATPWDVGVWDASSGPGEARYSSDGSHLTSAHGATNTTLSVGTPSGPLWSGADTPFDIYVGGERIRVTAVSGAGATQTFTVTRSINGVVKAHPISEPVRLFKPAHYAL